MVISSGMHLMHTQTSIWLDKTTTLLAEKETVTLSSPVTLIPNHRYAATFEMENDTTTTRRYLGASLLNSNQCALVHTSNNRSWMLPVDFFPPLYNTYDFFLQANSDYQTMTTILAIDALAVVSAIDPLAIGFGQTFNSGNVANLTSLSLYLAAGTTSEHAISVTLRVYDIESLAGENVVFPFYQETLNPSTLSPTTTSPTTTSPTTTSPTTTSPTTTSPTTTSPTTTSPTTTSPTSTSPTTISPTTTSPTTITSPTSTSPTTISPTTTSLPTITMSPGPGLTTSPSSMSHSTSPSSVSPSSVSPSSMSPTSSTLTPSRTAALYPPEYFVPAGECSRHVFLPRRIFENNHIIVECNDSVTATDIFLHNDDAFTVRVGEIVSVTAFNNGRENELHIQNISLDERIVIFVPFSAEGKQLLFHREVGSDENDGLDLESSVLCAWWSETNRRWETSELSLMSKNSELTFKFLDNDDDVIGRYCYSNHLTSFSLILRYNHEGPSPFERTIAQYVYAAVSGVIAVIAAIQAVRAIIALRACTVIVVIHVSVWIAATITLLVALLFPLLAYHPAVLVFLTSVVTCIELGCYICLVYVWTAPLAIKQTVIIHRLKIGLQVFLGMNVITTVGIPIMLVATTTTTYATNDEMNITMIKVGSYLMSIFGAIMCIAIMYSGIRLHGQLRGVRTMSSSLHHSASSRQSFSGMSRLMPVSTRILVGSVSLGLSVMAQALLWSLSVTQNLYTSASNGIEIGFNLVTFITFTTLLFMFWFGVNEAEKKRHLMIALQHASAEAGFNECGSGGGGGMQIEMATATTTSSIPRTQSHIRISVVQQPPQRLSRDRDGEYKMNHSHSPTILLNQQQQQVTVE